MDNCKKNYEEYKTNQTFMYFDAIFMGLTSLGIVDQFDKGSLYLISSLCYALGIETALLIKFLSNEINIKKNIEQTDTDIVSKNIIKNSSIRRLERKK